MAAARLFTKISFVYISVCVHVRPLQRLLTINGMISTPYDWLNKTYSLCMAAIVSILSRPGL